MTFDEWWSSNENTMLDLASYPRDVAKDAWGAATKAERAACASVANQQLMTSWNAETDSHNRCAELIRNLVLMRSNVDFSRCGVPNFEETTDAVPHSAGK